MHTVLESLGVTTKGTSQL